MWQEFIVGLFVVAAALFLVRHWFFTPKNKQCGGCNSCDKNQPDSCGKSSL